MEYVVLTTVHPGWLTVHLPEEVAHLLQYGADSAGARGPGRGLGFLARGPGVVRVVDSFRARELIPLESARGRYLALAHVSDQRLFNLPHAVLRYAGVQLLRREEGSAGWTTDDMLVWFVPAPEYYEYRARERRHEVWKGPSTGGLAHVYLARGLVPIYPELDDLEASIHDREWAPRIAALRRAGRPRAEEPESPRPAPRGTGR